MAAPNPRFAFVDAYTPASREALTASELAQLGGIELLIRGGTRWDGALLGVQIGEVTRYKVVVGDRHVYDAWIHNRWTLVVFAPGAAQVLAWWGDQDSDAVEGFTHVYELEAAFHALDQ